MNIGIVIVTYNRLEKLKKCLAAYERQTYPVSFICIVNNASNDGTKEFLNDWQFSHSSHILIHNTKNLGGAGGFTTGINSALALNSDWIWLADDDAYPAPDCIEQLANYYESLSPVHQDKISALCAKVVDNTSISLLHRRIMHTSPLQLKEIPLTNKDYKKSANEINIFSFVGTAIRTDVIKKIGLPRDDFFIFFDDTEYSFRVQQLGKIICVSNSVILHDSPENTIQTYSWKNYYMFRNKLYTYRTYFSTRYYFVEILKQIHMIFQYHNTSASWKQFFAAIHDATTEKMGKKDKYLP